MGIPKLFCYMRENGLFSSVILRDVASKLVIDGFGLCYALHRGIKCGDYYEFYDKVVKFFKQLKIIGVEAYVVFDGIYCENKDTATDKSRLVRRLELLQKMECQRERLAGSESFLPFLAKVVFVDALRENGINFFVADGEADRDIVSLANHLSCPALSKDSDFLIFNLEHGVILMPDNPEDVFSQVEFFEYQTFVNRCHFANHRVRLFLPYCLGNDFYGRHGLHELEISSGAEVSLIFEKLRMNSLSVESYRELESYVKFYEVAPPRSFGDLSQNSVLSQYSIPPWIVARFKRGQFSRDAMDFLVSSKIWKYMLMFEDLAKDSAWVVTDSVFKFVIGALLSYKRGTISSVVVVRRLPLVMFENVDIFPSLQRQHFYILRDYTLLKVPEMPEVERQKIVLRVFHCKHILNELKDVPEDLKLAVIASRCWLRAISKKIDHRFKAFVVALVLCIQKCYDPSERRFYSPKEMTGLDQIHYLAQWECMLYLANMFNQILDCPFAYASLGKLFSATRFQNYFVKDPDPMFMALSGIGGAMYGAITKDLLPEAPQPHPRQVVAPRQQGIAIQNRFKLLASKKV